MKEDFNYKTEHQRKYGQDPYSERCDKYDIDPEVFAYLMLENFKESGILDLIEQEEISMLASSVSTGKKDWEFLKHLDDHFDKVKKFHKPFITLTDFALKGEGKEKKPIIKKPEQEYENLNTKIVACDSYHFPFKENEFHVLYERLGALFHAADEDSKKERKGKLIQKMLEEYKRVVKPNGKIIIDWTNSVSPYSTANRILDAIKVEKRKSVIRFLEKQGFNKIQFIGEDESFIVLTNPDNKKSKTK